MLIRRFLAPAVLVALLLPAGAATAAEPPGSTANDEYADQINDAPSAVDITTVHVYRADQEYRAVIKYRDLRLQDANRWYVRFSAPGLVPGQAGGDGNIVEVRRTPGGQMKTLAFKSVGGTVTPATCPGTRVNTRLVKRKFTFVIPDACWRGGTTAAVVSAGARHYVAGTFDTTNVPPATGTVYPDSDTLDSNGTWLFGAR